MTPARLARSFPAALLVAATAVVPASADTTAPAPYPEPDQAIALAAELGDTRTGGIYYDDNGRLVLTVTDQAAARTAARHADGIILKQVTRSTAELAAIHDELDALGAIDNTSWGAETDTNQVVVELFDGAPADSRARIEKVAAAHPGAIRIEQSDSRLSFKATDLRGGNKIYSPGIICTAGFNTKDVSGKIWTLTAGHCKPGTGHTWYMDWNNAKIGTQTAYGFGRNAGDWATVRANASGIRPLGTVRYHGGIYKQIDRSRYPVSGELIHRIGAFSQDKTGKVTKQSVTATIDGVPLHGMFESDVCALGGDSGGPALRETTALGLLSGGSSETKCTSSTTGKYRNYFMPVQKVLNDRGLRVY